MKKQTPSSKQTPHATPNTKSTHPHSNKKLFTGKAEGKFKDIFDNMLEGCQVIDFDWRYVYLNNAALQQTSKTREKLLGYTMMECYPGIEKTAMFSYLRRSMEERREYRVENKTIFPNGTQAWLELRMEPLPQGVLIFSIDITEHKKLEARLKKHHAQLDKNIQELAKFKEAVDSASDMIIITDPDGVVVYANKSCQKITGFSPREIMGKKAGSLWKSPMPDQFYKRMWTTIKNQHRAFNGDIRNQRKNGEFYDAHITISPVFDKKGTTIIFFVGIERDITREKQIDRAKTEFVSLASHQLRTPPAIINWSVEALLDDKNSALKGERKRLLHQVFLTNQRMIKLIDAMLNISRMELGTFIVNPKSFHLSDLVDDELAELKLHILHKSLRVTRDYTPDQTEIYADRNFMQIIFHNLISNAIKYTPANGTIKISIKRGVRSIKIKIADNGCGIPLHQQDKIFTKLFRADNARVIDTDGTGLGLYLVKSLVDYAHGKIWFTTKENKGTIFYIDLPLGGMHKKEGVTQLVTS